MAADSVSAVCIECGTPSSNNVYKEYSGGSIQLSQCEYCGDFLDKYWEYDAVFLMLDVLLLRIQAYRHLLFNYRLSTSLLWRLSVVLVLCIAYINSRLSYDDRLGDDFALLQVNFHLSLAQAFVDFLAAMIVTALSMMVLNSLCIFWSLVLKIIIITRFAFFFAVVLFIWVDEFFIKFLLFLVVPAQLRSYQAIFSAVSLASIIAIVSSQSLLLFLIHVSMTNIKTRTFEYFLDLVVSQ